MGADRRLNLAPMMERTDRHFRFLLRLITRRTRLYSEMVVDRTLIHGDPPRHLDFHPAEHPVALQIGSAEPRLAARAVAIARGWGYDEVNLNVGCPSPRAQAGGFGVVLMRRPERVAEIVRAVYGETGVRLSIKHRTGVDELAGEAFLARFVEEVAGAGARVFIVHARKAWTQGLDPKANREVPPLKHEAVYRLKRTFPELTIVTNGGIQSPEEVRAHLEHVDGAMVGRAMWDRPWRWAEADRLLWGEPHVPERRAVLERYQAYLEDRLAEGTPLRPLLRPLFNLFKGERGGRRWRQALDAALRAGRLPPGGLVALAPLEEVGA
ncbi:tRNA dihydrouridine(20/20a) synthase DusA [Oceanithermus sp.]|uniref:tRNA dihydrouridine(20/20a) synthase DusA n=1 Tax=Oceanithermus sp. TaxID=2268145 RepID=UPI0025FD1B27|nr:tRNA dihydrouridine(20/20a) synthase DusA [Oceanithermus sp.]